MNRKITIFAFLTILFVGVSLLYSCKEENEELSAKALEKKIELVDNEIRINYITDTSSLSYISFDYFKTASAKYSAKSIPKELSFDFIPEYNEVGDIHVLNVDDNIYSMECDGDEFKFMNFRTEENKILFDAQIFNSEIIKFSIENNDLSLESILEYLNSGEVLPNPFAQYKVSNIKGVWVIVGAVIAVAAIVVTEVGRQCTNTVMIEAENCRLKGGTPHARACSVKCDPKE